MFDSKSIKVIGVGGAGGNIAASMSKKSDIPDRFYAINSDVQALNAADIAGILQIGSVGRGCGGHPELGKQYAEESIEDIKGIIKDAKIVFVVVGEGGGTGTGAAPVVAKAAKEAGAMVIGIATTPFEFEGKGRVGRAKDGLEEFKTVCDGVLVYHNDDINKTFGKIPMREGFDYANQYLELTIDYICRTLTDKSYINVDFADFESLLKDNGQLFFGLGKVELDGDLKQGVKNAVSSPLYRDGLENATTAIVNIRGSDELPVYAAYEAIDELNQLSKNDVDIKFGLTIDKSLGNKMETVIFAH